jgi:hypothetical protein
MAFCQVEQRWYSGEGVTEEKGEEEKNQSGGCKGWDGMGKWGVGSSFHSNFFSFLYVL